MPRQIKTSKPIVVSIFCGLILALAFPPFNISFLAWCSFLPLFFIAQKGSLKNSFFFFYLSGFVFFLISLWWLTNVTISGWILLCLYLSLYFGFFGLFLSFLSTCLPEKKNFYLLIIIPTAWVAIEFLRSHLLSGFGWNLIGYSQFKQLNLIQIADICSVYGVSFLLVFTNCILWLIISNLKSINQVRIRRQILILFLIFSIVSGLVWAYGKLRLNQDFIKSERPLRVSVIQPNIPQDLKWNPEAREYIFDRLIDLTLAAKKDEPDMIIWPESAVPVYLEEDSSELDKIFKLAKELDIYLLTGVIVYENDRFFNSALLISAQGKPVARYDKLHLVPFGEFIPLRKILPFLSAIVGIGDFTPGKKFKVFDLFKDNQSPTGRFSVLICFEDAFSYISRGFVNKGASFLINITNDAWFGQGSQPEQHLANSVFRAIENRVTVVRCANTGISAFIDAKGQVKGTVSDASSKKIFISGFLTLSLNERFQSSAIYSRFGDLFAYACLALTILTLALIKFSAKKRMRND
ncbi:MAG: apolipoprotein N-acyltransferase [Candidatus Omnitrophota bacterium]